MCKCCERKPREDTEESTWIYLLGKEQIRGAEGRVHFGMLGTKNLNTNEWTNKLGIWIATDGPTDSTLPPNMAVEIHYCPFCGEEL